MDLKTLSEKFVISEETTPQLLAELIEGLLPHCVVRKNGVVDISAAGLSGGDLARLVLAARLVASKLPDSAISGDVTTDEIAEYTGLPRNQAAARAKDTVDQKFSERTARGSYRARQHKVRDFVRNLPEPPRTGKEK
jgi:hypothetical protein